MHTWNDELVIDRISYNWTKNKPKQKEIMKKGDEGKGKLSFTCL